MEYARFFEQATGRRPFPFQTRLGTGDWPELIDVPTGLGKTGAVTIAWLHRQLLGEDDASTRLVWCLPMRVLVEQTLTAIAGWVENVRPAFEDRGRPVPTVEMLMGGSTRALWAERPERPAAIVGTQDMLLSRALMRGYGMSRFAWPIHFAWLHNDALWVFDETQLMGVGVETSAQLEAFRHRLGTAKPVRSIWMSATLGQGQLETVDHPRPGEGWNRLTLSEEDLAQPAVLQRTRARKAIRRAEVVVDKDAAKETDKNRGGSAYAQAVARRVTELHREGTLTLVILNRVSRAQAVFEALRALQPNRRLALLHSRFRPPERRSHAEVLAAEGDRIVVSTQVVEAGVDVSARALVTELAPWSSLVQRFGRCNRYGEFDEAEIEWIDVAPTDEKDDCGLPYEKEPLDVSRQLVGELIDAGPQSLAEVTYEPPAVVRPVLRRKDLVELFDTTPDLAGNDLDVSRYVRDETNDNDLSVFWRAIENPDASTPEPSGEELCAVTLAAGSSFVRRKSVTAWSFDALDKAWTPVSKLRPGQTVLLRASDGGYHPQLGFTGESAKKNERVPVVVSPSQEPPEGQPDDPSSKAKWLSLFDHVRNVVRETGELAEALGVEGDWLHRLVVAANWHDVGKAHEAFQALLRGPGETDERYRAPDAETIWAKSNHDLGKPGRKYFRHELASALAFLQLYRGEGLDAMAYLIASHHGKVRLSIRSLPGENEPDSPEAEGLFARGVWHGDRLPALGLPDGTRLPETRLDLRVLRLGQGSWLERTLGLRDDPEVGPFRLAWYESILRIGDQRASARERGADHD